MVFFFLEMGYPDTGHIFVGASCEIHFFHLELKAYFSYQYSNKRVLNFLQQVFFLLSTEGSIVINRAY